MIDVAIPSDSNIRKKKHEKLEKYQGLKKKVKKDVGIEGSSATSGDWSTLDSDPQTRRIAPADPNNNIIVLCPEDCSRALRGTVFFILLPLNF